MAPMASTFASTVCSLFVSDPRSQECRWSELDKESSLRVNGSCNSTGVLESSRSSVNVLPTDPSDMNSKTKESAHEVSLHHALGERPLPGCCLCLKAPTSAESRGLPVRWPFGHY